MRHVLLRVVDERDIPHGTGPCQNHVASALILLRRSYDGPRRIFRADPNTLIAGRRKGVLR